MGTKGIGNRTILSSASDTKMLDNINLRIKERELGRPLGPSILDEDKNVLLGNIKYIWTLYEYSLRSPKMYRMFPAIIHVDDTFRPELVKKEFIETYYKQMSAIKKNVGSSIVINTSFNIKMPIIFHVEDAIDFFSNSAIDMLVFNNKIVVEKTKN